METLLRELEKVWLSFGRVQSEIRDESSEEELRENEEVENSLLLVRLMNVGERDYWTPRQTGRGGGGGRGKIRVKGREMGARSELKGKWGWV